MSIKSIMTSPVISIGMDETIRLVGQHFKNREFHHLPVVDKRNKVQGIVSDRDYLAVASPYLNTPSESRRDIDIMLRRAHTIMSRNPVTLHQGASLSEAARLLLGHGVSSLLVTNESGELAGILTLKDVVQAIADANVDIVSGKIEPLPEPEIELEST